MFEKRSAMKVGSTAKVLKPMLTDSTRIIEPICDAVIPSSQRSLSPASGVLCWATAARAHTLAGAPGASGLRKTPTIGASPGQTSCRAERIAKRRLPPVAPRMQVTTILTRPGHPQECLRLWSNTNATTEFGGSTAVCSIGSAPAHAQRGAAGWRQDR